MAAPAFAFTISRAVEILGRGRAALVGLSRRDASGERLSLGSMAPRISRRLPVLNGWFRGTCSDSPIFSANHKAIPTRPCSELSWGLLLSSHFGRGAVA